MICSCNASKVSVLHVRKFFKSSKNFEEIFFLFVGFRHSVSLIVVEAVFIIFAGLPHDLPIIRDGHRLAHNERC